MSDTTVQFEKKGKFKPLPLKKLSEKFIEKALHESIVDKNLEKANLIYNKINIKSSLTGEDISYTPMINWGSFDIKSIIEKLSIVSETITGVSLYAYQKKVQQRIFESMLKNDGEEISVLFSRQCIPGNQYIFMADGTVKPIKDIKIGDKIISINSNNEMEEDIVEDKWSVGIKDRLKITSVKGLQIESSPKHLYYNPNGWKEAGCLVSNKNKYKVRPKIYKNGNNLNNTYNHIVGTSFNTIFGNSDLNENRSKLLGYLIADGSYKTTPKFTNISEEYLKEFEYLIKKEFNVNTKRYSKGNGFDILVSNGLRTKNSNNFTTWLRSIGIYGQIAENKIIPDIIFSSKKDSIKSFLNRLYAADGWISAKQSSPEIGIGVQSLKFAKQVSFLLLKFGIGCNIQKQPITNKMKKDFWKVRISKSEYIVRFFNSIDFIFGKEKNSAKAYEISKNRLKKHRDKVNKDIVWDTILDIQKLSPVEMYDIRTKKNHNFICEGFIVHNSGKTEVLTCSIVTIMIMFPVLAKVFPKQLGMYSKGVIIGLFAPTNEQAFTMHSRMDARLSTDLADQILSDSSINASKKYSNGILTINGPVIRTIGEKSVYDYVSICRLQSAAKQSKVESKTYHLIVMDEAQDIEAEKTQRSIRPMVAAVNGTIVSLGTPTPQISDFYNMILRNKRTQHYKKVQNHYEYDYREAQKYNPKYKAFIKKEMERLGEDSDSFRMAYKLEWLLEKGMALTPQQFEEYLKITGLRYEYVCDETSDYVAGVDLAKVMDDTIITVAKLKECEEDPENPVKTIVNWIEMSGDNWEVQFNTILDVVRTYRIKLITVDSTGGRDILVERLQLALQDEDCMVVPVVFNQKSKHEMATLFYEEMRKMKIQIPSNQIVRKTRRYKSFVEQFLSAEKNYKGPYLQIEHPAIKGAKDDYIDSLLLMLYGAKKYNFQPVQSSKNIFFNTSGVKSERFKKAMSQLKKRHRATWAKTMRI